MKKINFTTQKATIGSWLISGTIIGLIALLGALGFIYQQKVLTFVDEFTNKETYVAEVTAEVVDERDSIQKVTDNVAQKYRELVEAEKIHEDDIERARKSKDVVVDKTEAYNMAVSQLNTYTK